MIFKDDALGIERTEHGVPRVVASDDAALYRGMGYCHALDRGMQMLMMRILGRGQVSKFLDSSDASLQVDLFFRRMGWGHGDDAEVERIAPSTRALLDAYVAGVNTRFAEKVPWELRVAGYKHSPWRIADCIVVARVISYISLAQTQGDVERLIVEMIQAGVGDDLLAELFPGRLDGLDSALIKRVALGQRHVPADLKWTGSRMIASNNWVVAGAKTASGKPMLANDPHLEINRLPNVWYEILVGAGERWGYGATMPGIPGLLLGRTSDVAWGATYTFADTVDSWIEDCREGQHRRGDTWHAFTERREAIERKGKPNHEVTFYENEHGTLDGDPHTAGLYFATKWSGAQLGAQSLEALLAMWRATSVEEGRALLGKLEPAFNWVLADREHIGYQMSGLIPKRAKASGLIPLPGWDAANDWTGYHAPSDLPRVIDPPEGFFVTANNDLNAHGKIAPITISMGGYRAERLAQLLAAKPTHDLDDMRRMQIDLTSLQAERFMAILRPLLPATEQGKLLAAWDCRYDKASRGAFLFERCYRELLVEVFGGVMGAEVTRHLLGETGIFVDFFDAFDRVLLAPTSKWLRGEDRAAVWGRVAARALATSPSSPWRDSQQLVLAHMMFGGKLPRFLGFDRGPITLEGGRATPHQGQIYRSGGRATSFAPSIRIVTDMARDEVHTALVGGPSDRRFSKWYVSDLARWQRGELKVLR